MRLAWLWVALPIAFQFVNGCAAPPASTDIEIHVDANSHTTSTSCFIGSADATAECHLVDVTVTNHGPYNSTAMSADHWSALDSAGQRWRDPIVSPDAAIPPGQTASATLGFAVPNGTRLVRLDWSEYAETISQPLNEA